MVADSNRSPGSNVGPDYGFDLIKPVIAPRKRSKYPGRNRVMARQDAIELRERQMLAEWADRDDPLPCLAPYMVEAIGVPSGATSLHRFRWKATGEGKVPVEVPSRCRRCENCLRHKQRLWTARAIDELKAASRTWFGTLTFRPTDRFRIDCQAAIASSRAGHGKWGSLDSDTKFQWLTKSAGSLVTDWLKRVRSVTGVPLRYLLVVEPHDDGFPHFHILMHEQDSPVRKALLEEQWRSGFSHWRLVKNEDPRSVYYACKYLTKSHQTRVRASRRYGQAHLVSRTTERMERVTRLMPVGLPPVEGGPQLGENGMAKLGSQRSEEVG